MSHEFFTLRHDPEVERRLAACLDDLRTRIGALPDPLRRPLAAVLLGGGYGAGEGGVSVRPDGHFPYNDLDLFVFTRGASGNVRHEIDHALGRIGEDWSRQLGIEIDFAGAREVTTLTGVASTMMYQALKAAHRMIYGDPDVLDGLPTIPAEALPVREGLRLMLNRGTGLLLAQEKIRRHDTDAAGVDFIWRNWHKCVFGIGDALLVARHGYSFRLTERLERLASAAGILAPDMAERLRLWYAESVEFKALPHSGPLEEAVARIPPLVKLWQDALFAMLADATGMTVETVAGARRALFRRDVFGGGVAWKNILLNLRYSSYPLVKERLDTAPQLWLLADLAQILLENQEDKGYIKSEERELKVARFLPLWQRFN